MGASPPKEPSAAMLNLSALVYLLGITVVTWCIAHATFCCPIWTKKSWNALPWPRKCLLLTLTDSWIYLVLTGVVLHGAPPRHSPGRCSFGIFSCILLYGSSKCLVYICLTERVHAVWGGGRQRRHSPIYLLCLVLLLPLGGIVVFMMIQAIHYVYNGYCILGIGKASSLILVIYDACVNLFLTSMFVFPLVQPTIRSPWIRAVAMRASIASFIALITTMTNVILVYKMDGQEMIWVCLGVCGTDIVINTVALYWAMQGPDTSTGQGVYISTTVCHTFVARPGLPGGDRDARIVHKNLPAQSTFPDTVESYDVISDSAAVASPPQVLALEKPKPVLQTPHGTTFAGQQLWTRQLTRPPTEEIICVGCIDQVLDTSEQKFHQEICEQTDV